MTVNNIEGITVVIIVFGLATVAVFYILWQRIKDQLRRARRARRTKSHDD